MLAMDRTVGAANYPISFRKNDAESLGGHIKHRHSAVLLGIKRVGISNFLNFFIGNREVQDTYVKSKSKHFFIPVDLNDLVESEIQPFWTLTLKRILDAVESSSMNPFVKKEISELFLESIQLQDLFFTIDSVRLSIKKIIEQGYLPTLFLIRFDRLMNSVTPELFANLAGLRDGTHQQLSYVFTSFLPFERIFPNVFQHAALLVGYKNVYIKPAEREDERTIISTYKKRYDVVLDDKTEEYLLELVDGHFRYLQLALIILHEKDVDKKDKNKLFEYLVSDESIRLQSEELWENLNKDEQTILLKIVKGEKVTKEDKKKADYLISSGFIKEENKTYRIFNPLFEYYVKEREKEEQKEASSDFSKKELLLFNLLKENKDEICERERIIEVVWPQEEELGVSDWAIDKLVGRVRVKLKSQDNNFEIQTVKTRGYKLVELV